MVMAFMEVADAIGESGYEYVMDDDDAVDDVYDDEAPAVPAYAHTYDYTCSGLLYSGSKEYPIFMEVSCKNGHVTGRYAYVSTLEASGDKASSWIPLKGTCDAEATELSLSATNPSTGEVFERFDLEMYQGHFVGSYHNLNTGKTFDVTLEVY